MRTVAALTLGLLIGSPALAQQPQPADPTVLMDQMIRQRMELDAQRRNNEATRLELERRDEEHYQRATNQQVMGELMRYCPSGEPPCPRKPPQALLQEASRRGLVEFKPQQPSTECVTMGDGFGGGVTDCY
jgi:hypothetical protein